VNFTTDDRRPRPLRPGDQVAMTGRVIHERHGFVTVRWDGGGQSIVWKPDLAVAVAVDERES